MRVMPIEKLLQHCHRYQLQSHVHLVDLQVVFLFWCCPCLLASRVVVACCFVLKTRVTNRRLVVGGQDIITEHWWGSLLPRSQDFPPTFG